MFLVHEVYTIFCNFIIIASYICSYKLNQANSYCGSGGCGGSSSGGINPVSSGGFSGSPFPSPSPPSPSSSPSIWNILAFVSGLAFTSCSTLVTPMNQQCQHSQHWGSLRVSCEREREKDQTCSQTSLRNKYSQPLISRKLASQSTFLYQR